MHWYKGAEWRVNMASTFLDYQSHTKDFQAAQTSITTTAHNLSNINTDGYTKQSVLLQASDALRTYSTYGTIGSGVNVVEIKQTRDSIMMRNIVTTVLTMDSTKLRIII